MSYRARDRSASDDPHRHSSGHSSGARAASLRRCLATLLALGALGVGANGCATGTHRGQLLPNRAQWHGALHHAVRSPATWAPALAAAAVIPWDRDVSDWAARETPVFGSRRSALRASDDLRTASDAAMLVTALLVPEEERPWGHRLKRVVVEEAAAVVSTSVTRGLKEATDRTRPDGSDRLSFPSGHASRAFAYNGATQRNLKLLALRGPASTGLRIGLGSLAAGTAWARVEAQVHYPSDVLFGAALGNFVSLLLHDAFLDRPEASVAPPVVAVELDHERKALAVTWRW